KAMIRIFCRTTLRFPLFISASLTRPANTFSLRGEPDAWHGNLDPIRFGVGVTALRSLLPVLRSRGWTWCRARRVGCIRALTPMERVLIAAPRCRQIWERRAERLVV